MITRHWMRPRFGAAANTAMASGSASDTLKAGDRRLETVFMRILAMLINEGFAVGEIFFAVDECAAGSVDAADDDAAAAEMIPQVIFDPDIRRAVP